MNKKKIIGILTVVCIMLAGCDEIDAAAGGALEGKTFTINENDSERNWYEEYYSRDMNFVVWVDKKTGVNYIIGVEKDSKGEFHYVMSARYNADGTLYTSEVALEE